MNLRHKIFQKFNYDLKENWISLEKKSKCNPFNSYYFHENIFKVNLIYKKKEYLPMIFCIFDNNDIIAILPLERFFLKTLVNHGSEFLDYEGIIFDESANIESLAKYLNSNLLKKYDIFLKSIEIENILVNNLKKIVNHKFNWEYTERYFIDINYFNIFFSKKKKFLKKMNKIINRKNLITQRIKSNKDKLTFLRKHIKLKSIQYKLTNTRNPFENNRYTRLLEFIIKNSPENIDIYGLFQGENTEAILISLNCENKLCYYQPSYNKESNVESPGKVLMYESIKLANQKLKEFDFSTGDEAYKKLYSTNSKKINSFYLSSRKIPNLLSLLFFWILFRKKNRNILKKIFAIKKKLLKI